MTGELGRLAFILTADQTQMIAGLTQAEGAAQKFTVSTQGKLDSINTGKAQNALMGLQKKFFGMLTGYLMFKMTSSALKSLTSDFVEFDSALADMTKVTDIPLDELSHQIMSMPSLLGTPVQLMKGYYEAFGAGIKESGAALDALRISSEAAKFAHLDQGDVLKGLTRIMAGMGGEVKDLTEASNLMLAVEDVSLAKYNELIPTMGEAASLAHALGLNSKELAGTIAQISLTARDTDDAMMKFRNLLIQTIKPSEMLAKVIASMPEGFRDAQQAIDRLGWVRFLRRINEAIAGVSESLGQMFPESRGALGFLAASTNDFKDLEKNVDSATKTLRTHEKAYEEWKKTAQAAIDLNKAAWEKFNMSIRAAFDPMISRWRSTLTMLALQRDEANQLQKAIEKSHETEIMPPDMLEFYAKLESLESIMTSLNIAAKKGDFWGFAHFLGSMNIMGGQEFTWWSQNIENLADALGNPELDTDKLENIISTLEMLGKRVDELKLRFGITLEPGLEAALKAMMPGEEFYKKQIADITKAIEEGRRQYDQLSRMGGPAGLPLLQGSFNLEAFDKRFAGLNKLREFYKTKLTKVLSASEKDTQEAVNQFYAKVGKIFSEGYIYEKELPMEKGKVLTAEEIAGFEEAEKAMGKLAEQSSRTRDRIKEDIRDLEIRKMGYIDAAKAVAADELAVYEKSGEEIKAAIAKTRVDIAAAEKEGHDAKIKKLRTQLDQQLKQLELFNEGRVNLVKLGNMQVEQATDKATKERADEIKRDSKKMYESQKDYYETLIDIYDYLDQTGNPVLEAHVGLLDLETQEMAKLLGNSPALRQYHEERIRELQELYGEGTKRLSKEAKENLENFAYDTARLFTDVIGGAARAEFESFEDVVMRIGDHILDMWLRNLEEMLANTIMTSKGMQTAFANVGGGGGGFWGLLGSIFNIPIGGGGGGNVGIASGVGGGAGVGGPSDIGGGFGPWAAENIGWDQYAIPSGSGNIMSWSDRPTVSDLADASSKRRPEQTQIVYNINAIDSKSFAEYVERNPAPIVGVMSKNVLSGGVFRRVTRQTLR